MPLNGGPGMTRDRSWHRVREAIPDDAGNSMDNQQGEQGVDRGYQVPISRRPC